MVKIYEIIDINDKKLILEKLKAREVVEKVFRIFDLMVELS